MAIIEEAQRVAADAQASKAALHETHRVDVLDKEVMQYVKRGYRVVSRTPTTAQLVRPKVFSRLWAILWTCVFLVGFLVYLTWYLAKRDQQVYLTVDDKAKIHRR